MTDLSALTDRIQALAGSQKMALARNRSRAPEFTAFVDEYRRVFGNVRVAFIQWPDGMEQGKRQPGPGVVPHLPVKMTKRANK